MVVSGQLIKRVAEVYGWLDRQVMASRDLAGCCEACGQCCDFVRFDHKLFVTAAELMYLAAKLGDENIKAMHSGRCPYNVGGKCTIYEYRFTGCRIFCCKGDADFQSQLSESAIKKLKIICTELRIAYRYIELADALNGFVG